MKFSLNKFISTSALLAFATSIIAAPAPLQDVSVTTVDLVENTYNAQGDEHLYVTVTRVDDLIDDDGSLLAERIMAVRVTFDVVENQLMCNGRPVEIGVSNIEVEAQMASNPDKLTITSEEDAAILADSFDVGLVTVEVTASILDDLKADDGMVFRRISVKEMITEINGQRVVQTEAGQQILDVFDNGSLIKWSVDPLSGFMLPGPVEMNDDSFYAIEDSDYLAVGDLAVCLIVGAICAFFALVGLVIRQFVVSRRTNYEAVESTQEASSEQIWDQKDQPPAYIEEEEQQQEEKKPFLA